MEDFKRQIQWLLENGFSFIGLDAAVEKRDMTDRNVLLTFDDGFKDHYQNVYPILEQYGIPGVFSVPGKVLRERSMLDVHKIHFILEKGDISQIIASIFSKLDHYRGREFPIAPDEELYDALAVASRFDDKDTIFVKRLLQTGLPGALRTRITDGLFREFVTEDEQQFAERCYMSMDDIKEMAKGGMQFAVHGYDHCWMDRLPEEELRRDLGQALEVFDGIIDQKNWCNCYPYGSYSDQVIQISREMGATSGMGTDVRKYGREDDVFRIPRLDTNDLPPRSDRYKDIR